MKTVVRGKELTEQRRHIQHDEDRRSDQRQLVRPEPASHELPLGCHIVALRQPSFPGVSLYAHFFSKRMRGSATASTISEISVPMTVSEARIMIALPAR